MVTVVRMKNSSNQGWFWRRDLLRKVVNFWFSRNATLIVGDSDIALK